MWPSSLLKKICEAFLHSTEDLPIVPLPLPAALQPRPGQPSPADCSVLPYLARRVAPLSPEPEEPADRSRSPSPVAGVSLDTLLAYFQGSYDYPTRPLMESQYQEGRALLTRYWEAHRGQLPAPYLLEEKFSLHGGPSFLAGRFDRVDETSEGYEIIDYKLSHRNPLQLDVYQLGFHAKTTHYLLFSH